MFHTYAADGIYSAMLRARDDHDPPATSNPAQVQLKVGNEATTPRITAPSTSLLFRVGQELTLTDNATDPEDGAMANDQLSWEVIRHHNNSHTHPSLKPTTGNNMKVAPRPRTSSRPTTATTWRYSSPSPTRTGPHARSSRGRTPAGWV